MGLDVRGLLFGRKRGITLGRAHGRGLARPLFLPPVSEAGPLHSAGEPALVHSHWQNRKRSFDSFEAPGSAGAIHRSRWRWFVPISIGCSGSTAGSKGKCSAPDSEPEGRPPDE